MIGNSHIINMRDKYHKIKKLFEVDYKGIFSKWKTEYWIIFFINRDTKTKVFRDWSWGLFRKQYKIFERCSSKGTIIDSLDNLEEKVKNVFVER